MSKMRPPSLVSENPANPAVIWAGLKVLGGIARLVLASNVMIHLEDQADETNSRTDDVAVGLLRILLTFLSEL